MGGYPTYRLVKKKDLVNSGYFKYFVKNVNHFSVSEFTVSVSKRTRIDIITHLCFVWDIET